MQNQDILTEGCSIAGDADESVCLFDEQTGDLKSPSECERCHRSCYCQDLDENQCQHDEMCTYDYSVHEAAATSATATPGMARRYLQGVSACTEQPEAGSIPPEARMNHQDLQEPAEVEMSPCCNCGACFEFGGPTQCPEQDGEIHGVPCCDRIREGYDHAGEWYYPEPHRAFCQAEFGTVHAGESRPSTIDEVVGGAPLSIAPPCVARELSESCADLHVSFPRQHVLVYTAYT